MDISQEALLPIFSEAMAPHYKGITETIAKMGIAEQVFWHWAAQEMKRAMDDAFKNTEDISINPLNAAAVAYYAPDAVETIESYLALRGQDKLFDELLKTTVNFIGHVISLSTTFVERLRPLADTAFSVSVTEHKDNKRCLQFLVYPKNWVTWEEDGKLGDVNFDPEGDDAIAVAAASTLAQGIYLAIVRGLADAISAAMLEAAAA